MGKVLTAAEIIGAKDRRRELVEVPEWGGSVWVQEISAADAEAMSDGAPSVVEFCAACIVDEHGERLFSSDDVSALADKSTASLQIIMEAFSRLNGRDEVEDTGKG